MTDEASAELARLKADVTDEDVALKDVDVNLDDSELIAEIAARMQESENADREFAMTLAAVRKAVGFTQERLAEQVGTSQSHISQIEAGGDLLVSTLLSYLRGAGIGAVTLIVTAPSGDHVSVDLSSMIERPAKASESVER